MLRYSLAFSFTLYIHPTSEAGFICGTSLMLDLQTRAKNIQQRQQKQRKQQNSRSLFHTSVYPPLKLHSVKKSGTHPHTTSTKTYPKGFQITSNAA